MRTHRRTRDDLRRNLDFAGQLVNRDDGQNESVLTQVSAVFYDQIFDDISPRTGINTDSADVHASGLACAKLVEFHDVAAFHHHDVADRAAHRSREFRVQLQLTVFAVNGDEVLGLDQIDNQL